MDNMVIETVSSLDDLDKELNNSVMRCKEWYGWHFPELTKIIPDNNLYIKIVLAMGFRENAINTDFSGILSKEDDQKVKQMADISKGTEIFDEDLTNIKNLCKEIQNMQECRARLFENLKNRMDAVAPNVAALVGAMVGARLIMHAGSLLKLAKHPGSTIQILGAERSHFSALKSGLNTPKHGHIYHAQLVGQSNKHLKGKVSRMLANKISLAARVDAFSEKGIDIGTEHCSKLKTSLKILEEGMNSRISGLGKRKAKNESKGRVFGKRKFDDEELAPQFKKSNVDFKELKGGKRKFDGEELAPQFKNLKMEEEEEGDPE